MNNKPISYENKIKDRNNEFLYDKCVKQYHIIMNYQSKMREYKNRIRKLEEENKELNDLPFIKYQKAILKITEVLDTKSIFIRKKKIKKILEEYYYESN